MRVGGCGGFRPPLPSGAAPLRPARRGPARPKSAAAAAPSPHCAAAGPGAVPVPVPLLSAATTNPTGTMPMFAIQTNVCKDAVPDSLLGELTQQLAKATGKPAQVGEGGGGTGMGKRGRPGMGPGRDRGGCGAGEAPEQWVAGCTWPLLPPPPPYAACRDGPDGQSRGLR